MAWLNAVRCACAAGGCADALCVEMFDNCVADEIFERDVDVVAQTVAAAVES